MRPSQIFPLPPPPPPRRRRGWAAPFYFDFLFFVRVHILERKQFFSRQILCRTSSQVTINTNIYFRFHHSCKNAWNKSQTMWPVLKNSKKFHILRKKSGFTQLKRRFCFCRARYKSTSFRFNFMGCFAKLTRAFSRLKLKNVAQIAHFLRTRSRRNSAPPALVISSLVPLESFFH